MLFQTLPYREVQGFLPWDPWMSQALVLMWAIIPTITILVVVALFLMGRKKKNKKKRRGKQVAGVVAFVLSLMALLALPIPAMLILPELTIEVDRTEIRAQLWPFQLSPERFPVTNIATHSVRTYDPVGEYGGWGMRSGAQGRAYNARGNEGVQLVFRDGSRMLLGSQRPDELDAALAQATGHRHQGR